MDFTERLDLYLEGGMIDEDDVKDVNVIIAVFKDKYGITLTEENADTFIAHLCAAFNRNKTHEEIDPVGEEILNEIKSLDSYEESLKMLDDVMKVMQHNTLNETEQNYALLHINNLIARVR